MARSTFVDWYKALPVPWLVAGVNGQREGSSWPAVVDSQIVLLDAARKVAYPDYAPSDALPNLGGDRKLVQGPARAMRTSVFASRVLGMTGRALERGWNCSCNSTGVDTQAPSSSSRTA
jgi:hypothetical protein